MNPIQKRSIYIAKLLRYSCQWREISIPVALQCHRKNNVADSVVKDKINPSTARIGLSLSNETTPLNILCVSFISIISMKNRPRTRPALIVNFKILLERFCSSFSSTQNIVNISTPVQSCPCKFRPMKPPCIGKIQFRIFCFFFGYAGSSVNRNAERS